MTRAALIQRFSILGLAIAVLSALEPHLAWLSTLCGFLGDGCRDAEAYTLFGFPVAWSGIGFYLFLSLLSLFRTRQIFWPVMAGLGFEILLVRIMVTQDFFCVFCVLNLLVILILSACALRLEFFWKSLTTVLAALMVFPYFVDPGTGAPGTGISGPGANRGNRDEIAAMVNGEAILHSDLETRVAGKVYSLRRDIYSVKRRQLDQKIQDRLIGLEAAKQGIPADELADRVYAGARAVTAADVAAYYEENRSHLAHRRETREELNEKIAAYLVSLNRNKAMEEFLGPLKETYQVRVLYEQPRLPSANVPVHNNPSLGPEDAAVTIVEFSDYLCPSCRSTHAVTKQVREKYKGKLRWIFKDYPLKRHKGAKYLATAARCAGEQGQFWAYQDLLFESEHTGMGRNEAVTFAADLGLDLAQYTLCLDSGKFLDRVEQDLADVRQAGVNSTPTFIINGKLHPGSLSLEEFSRMIDQAL